MLVMVHLLLWIEIHSTLLFADISSTILSMTLRLPTGRHTLSPKLKPIRKCGQDYKEVMYITIVNVYLELNNSGL
jgi:hypothetical protein